MARNAAVVTMQEKAPGGAPPVDGAPSDRRRIARTPDLFARTLAHELESSLIVVSRYIATLRELDPTLSPEQADIAERIARTTKRMQAYLSSVSALASGDQQPELVPASLEGVITDALETIQPLIDELCPEIVITGELGVIVADRAQLAQLLSNLVANAIKFGPSRGRVTVSFEHTHAAWQIEVSDQGPGIPRDARELIFEPFQRLPATSHVPGVGLGLALCRQLAENHDGTLTVSSNRPGATFVLTLPDRRLVAVGSG
jgi:two-component system sensor histidine kinase KdpD